MGVPTEKPNTACKDERMTCQKKEDLKKGIGTYVIKKIQWESSLNTVNVTSSLIGLHNGSKFSVKITVGNFQYFEFPAGKREKFRISSWKFFPAQEIFKF